MYRYHHRTLDFLRVRARTTDRMYCLHKFAASFSDAVFNAPNAQEERCVRKERNGIEWHHFDRIELKTAKCMALKYVHRILTVQQIFSFTIQLVFLLLHNF